MRKNNRLQRSDILWGVSVAAFMVLQFWWLPGEKGRTADSWSTTSDGKLGLYRTLQQLFPEVIRQNDRLIPDPEATLLVISPDRYPSDLEESELYEFVYTGGTLLFAPNWSTDACELPSLGIELSTRFFVRSNTAAPGGSPPTAAEDASNAPPGGSPPTGSGDSDTAELPAEAELDVAEAPDVPQQAESSDSSEGSASGNGNSTASAKKGDSPLAEATEVQTTSTLVSGSPTWRTCSTLVPPEHLDYEVLIRSADSVEAATWTLGSGRVLVCSSPDVFSNRSLLFQDSRRLAFRLIEYLHQSHGSMDPLPADASGAQDIPSPIVLNEYLNASDSWRQTGVLFSPALRIGTLQLSMVALLGLWYGFHRFGPARITQRAQRRSLQDTARAVGNLQFGLRDGGTVVRGYLEYLRSQLRRRYGGTVSLEHSDALALRTGMDADEIRASLQEAERLALSPGVSPAKAAASLRWLSELQSRLAGIHK